MSTFAVFTTRGLVHTVAYSPVDAFDRVCDLLDGSGSVLRIEPSTLDPRHDCAVWA